MMGVVGINIYASDDRIEEIDNPSAIKFKSFDYDSSSKKFYGDFFDAASQIFGQLKRFYTGQYRKVLDEKLLQAQTDFESISMNFVKEELNTLRSQKSALKERNENLTNEDLTHRNILKRQEGEILLQESIVEHFVVKT